MYRPKKGSLRDQMCLAILERGEVTAQECVELFGAHREGDVKGALSQLKRHGALREDNGVYWLADHIKRHYGVKVVEPKEVQAEPETPVSRFKPWTGKYDPLNSLNGARIERRGFVTVCSRVPVSYEY